MGDVDEGLQEQRPTGQLETQTEVTWVVKSRRVTSSMAPAKAARKRP